MQFSERIKSSKYLKSLEKIFNDRPILFLVIFSILLRIIWIDAPVIRDEADGGYLSMLAINGYPLYSFSGSTRTPLFYALYSVGNIFSPANIILVRFVANFIFWISVIFFYRLLKNIFGQKEAFVATLFYSIFLNVPIFSGMMAIPVSIVTPLSIIAFSMCNIYVIKNKRIWLVYSGLILSSAFLILQDQLLGMIILILYLFEIKIIREKRVHEFFKDFIVLTIFFSIPILLSLGFFLINGEFADYFPVLYAQKSLSAYAEAPFMPESVQLVKILEGMPLFVFSIFGILKLFKGRSIALPFFWILITFVRAIMPPDYPHHLIYFIPPLAMLSSLGIFFTFNYLKKIVKNAKAISIILITLLMTPVLILSIVQYPTTDINWNGLGWNNTWVSNSNAQRSIAQSINQNAKNGSLLIHGWLPELYWLSQRKAPSIYVYTYNPPDLPLHLPPQEYNHLLNQVEAQKFEVVVLPAFVVPDAIINSTRNNYVIIETINGIEIYGKTI